MQIGPLTVRDTGRRESTEGETVSGKAFCGMATIYEIEVPGATLEVHDVRWENGERDVRTEARLEGPTVFDELAGRLRIGVDAAPNGRRKMRLRIPARSAPHKMPTFHQTSVAELDKVCGIDTAALLYEAGAIKVDVQRLAIGDTSRTKNELCVVFDDNDFASTVPIVAYTVTPVLAFWKQFA